MISKELLSEVLGFETRDVRLSENLSSLVLYTCNECEGKGLNIHELAHKVKEWAYNNNYFITSNLKEANVYPINSDGWIMKLELSIDEKTEPEAIFKAGQWILENR